MIYAAVMSLFVAGHQLIMQNWRSSVICAITFGAGLLLTSATGLYFAYFSLNVGHRFSVESALYSQATYLCLEELLLAIMAACVVFSGIPSSLRSAALLLAALLCTSHIIGNLDVIFGRYLAGLQARPLFIQPLVIALLVGAVAESVTLFSHHSVRKSFGIFLTLLICIGPIIRSGTLSLGVLQEKGDKAALFQHIASSTNNNSVIALLPYDLSQEVPTLLHNHSDLPNELFFITGRRMISDYMGIQNVATPHIIAEREMLLGLIYTDRPALVRDCITPLSRYQKVDSYQYWLFHWLQLQDICHEEVSLQKNVTPCEFVGKYHFEYIIRDPQSPRNTSSFIAKYGQREWKSDSGAYSLLHYSSHRAISDFCSK
jgi:hypothetical protein